MIIIIATIKSTPRAAVKMIHNALSEKNLRLELGARLVGGSDEIKKKKRNQFSSLILCFCYSYFIL